MFVTAAQEGREEEDGVAHVFDNDDGGSLDVFLPDLLPPNPWETECAIRIRTLMRQLDDPTQVLSGLDPRQLMLMTDDLLHIPGDLLTLLIKAIRENETIDKLLLHVQVQDSWRTWFGREGLVASLQEMPRLRSIALEGDVRVSDACALLQRGVRSATIEQVEIAAAPETDAEARLLATQLSRCSQLQSIALTTYSAQDHLPTLATELSSLRHLSRVRFLGDEEHVDSSYINAPGLASFLRIPSLRMLSLDYYFWEQDQIQVLTSELPLLNNNLTDIHLTNITCFEGLEEVVECICSSAACASLERLTLDALKCVDPERIYRAVGELLSRDSCQMVSLHIGGLMDKCLMYHSDWSFLRVLQEYALPANTLKSMRFHVNMTALCCQGRDAKDLFEPLAQVLKTNQTLERVTVVVDKEDFHPFVPLLEMRELGSVVEALRRNYTLQDLYFTSTDDLAMTVSEDVTKGVDAYCQLNQAGRGILRHTPVLKRSSSIHIMSQVTDNLDAIYVYLLDNPSICDMDHVLDFLAQKRDWFVVETSQGVDQFREWLRNVFRVDSFRSLAQAVEDPDNLQRMVDHGFLRSDCQQAFQEAVKGRFERDSLWLALSTAIDLMPPPSAASAKSMEVSLRKVMEKFDAQKVAALMEEEGSPWTTTERKLSGSTGGLMESGMDRLVQLLATNGRGKQAMVLDDEEKTRKRRRSTAGVA